MKKLLLLLIILIFPTITFASYEPDPQYWNWHSSSERHGYFISKEPVKLVQDTDVQTVYRANVQVVFATPYKNAKFIIARVEITRNKQTDDVYIRWLTSAAFNENKQTVETMYKTTRQRLIIPSSMHWRIYEMIIDTYGKQQNKKAA